LGKKNIEAKDPISMKEVEPYWKSLWGEEAQLNERTECLRREESRKMGNTDFGPIQVMKITSFLSKVHNFKFYGND
jgi:hypothetical protein